MRAAGICAVAAAAAMGLSASTIGRWRSNRRQGLPLRQMSGPAAGRVVTPDKASRADALVRATQGLIGADALRQAAGISRRAAAAIKQATPRRWSGSGRRRASGSGCSSPAWCGASIRSRPRAPAVWGFLLRCADAAVPFTTLLDLVARYDAAAVIATIKRDWDLNGEPLVLRLDRAVVHLVEPLRDMAEARGVLLLHGPAYYPRFYGQLERGNRDLRNLLAAAGAVTPEERARRRRRAACGRTRTIMGATGASGPSRSQLDRVGSLPAMSSSDPDRHGQRHASLR